MMTDEHSHIQFVIVGFDDGTVGRLQIHKAPRVPAGTQLIGFDAETGEREMSDEVLQSEVDRTNWGKPGVPVTGWRKATVEDFPDDPTFRTAWTFAGKKISIDMDKARDITRDRLRSERAPIMAEKDVAVIRAMETGDKAAIEEITAEKQRLRDITALPDIDAARTPEELKAISIEQA